MFADWLCHRRPEAQELHHLTNCVVPPTFLFKAFPLTKITILLSLNGTLAFENGHGGVIFAHSSICYNLNFKIAVLSSRPQHDSSSPSKLKWNSINISGVYSMPGLLTGRPNKIKCNCIASKTRAIMLKNNSLCCCFLWHGGLYFHSSFNSDKSRLRYIAALLNRTRVPKAS